MFVVKDVTFLMKEVFSSLFSKEMLLEIRYYSLCQPSALYADNVHGGFTSPVRLFDEQASSP